MNYRKLQDSIIAKLKTLSEDKHILGAYIFGSIARGEFGKNSDIDVKVLVDKSSCLHINHPYIDGVKSDMTFMSYDDMVLMLDKQVAKKDRIPMIAESIVVFDKTGQLQKLKKKYSAIKPTKYKNFDYQNVIYLAQHFTDCISRNLEDDKITALLSMHINLQYLLEIRYRTLGRWQVGSKRLFKDIKSFDKPLSVLLEKYLKESDLNRKFDLWLSMRDHILKPLGGSKPVKELNCDCRSCKSFLRWFSI
jgi:predicted nucleotidyltransferase